MANRKQRALARKRTASKRRKAHTRLKSSPRKAAKQAIRKMTSKKRVAVKAKARQRATRLQAEGVAPQKTARPIEPPRQLAEATEETLIVDIIDEPVPGVVVVTEFESVRTSKPQAPTAQPEGGEGSNLAERKGEGQ